MDVLKSIGLVSLTTLLSLVVLFLLTKLMGAKQVSQMTMFDYVEGITIGSVAVGYLTESMHGADSPQAQRIMIARQGNIQGKKQLAKDIAGIVD